MNSEVASLVVIVLIAIGSFFAYRANIASGKRNAEALTSPKKMEDWMSAQKFVPDHFSFFHGTGIALKDGDDKIVLYESGHARFFSIADITSINAHEWLDRGVPRGAAPGVVELNVAQRFVIDITLKHAAKPLRVMFTNRDLSKLWEGRLGGLIGSTN